MIELAPADSLPAGADFHHIGYACASLPADQLWFEKLGFRVEGDPFVDEVQGIAGCFLVGIGPRIELLENLPGRETLTPWLSSGIRMYHLAYVVPEIDVALSWAKSMRARVVAGPVPAVAFAGRQIAFVMMRNGLLLEFVQGQRPNDDGGIKP